MKRFSLIASLLLVLFTPATSLAAGGGGDGYEPHYTDLSNGRTQYAPFPIPPEHAREVDGGILEILQVRIEEDPFNLAATIIFFCAILHTFMASKFLKISHRLEHDHEQKLKKHGIKDDLHPDGVPEVSFKATLFHFLGEIEAVFGLWVIALAGAATYFHGWTDFKYYIAKDRNFTEPLFVVIIMAIASSRPVLRFAEKMMSGAAKFGKGSPTAWWLSVLIIAPILGSFITEPAAMTIAALLLAKKFYRYNPPAKLAYATLGLLFVNISVGGTLTHFAAPPVLMVAGTWGWDTPFMMMHFGWKAAIGIFIATGAYYLFFRKELFRLSNGSDGQEDDSIATNNWHERENPIPVWVTVVHLFFLAWTVYNAHYPAMFIGGFLFYLAFSTATQHHQNPVALRTPILVGFFLAGLIVHGGCQSWWISPVITSLDAQLLMFGSTVLTAFNDNAAITYLAAQVPDISQAAKHAVVAGAVIGGGLTVIANAPNPAGQSILSKFFKGGISPFGLLLGALVPTAILYACFVFLPILGPSYSSNAETKPKLVEQAKLEQIGD